MKVFLLLLFYFSLILASFAEARTTYYDVDFSSPTHVVGSEPTIGQGIDTPSIIDWGSPLVQSSLGELNDQPVVLNVIGNSGPSYENIRFFLNNNADTYSVSFDILTENYITSEWYRYFRVIVGGTDTGIHFMRDGNISLNYDPDVIIGSFTDNTAMHIDMELDTISGTMSAFMNFSHLYTGPFSITCCDGSYDISYIDFGLQDTPIGSHNDSIGLDNILISGSVIPEPISSALFLIGGATLGIRCFIRRKLA